MDVCPPHHSTPSSRLTSMQYTCYCTCVLTQLNNTMDCTCTQVRNWKRFSWLEWTFVVVATFSILGILGESIARFIIVEDLFKNISHYDNKTQPYICNEWICTNDFIFTVVLVLNIGKLLIYFPRLVTTCAGKVTTQCNTTCLKESFFKEKSASFVVGIRIHDIFIYHIQLLRFYWVFISK